ncbi:hypothetical protein D1867_08975 [Acidianus infernus]|uniref:Uncharacterized protein n=1 Tax=Acidianus infernus TaxID=12915 RepID=A0A6A9QJ98_ACIIN|nr:hypothetical protein [Acidianus infernus]MUM65370.1 hypothetical protein [Acidianus infernus]
MIIIIMKCNLLDKLMIVTLMTIITTTYPHLLRNNGERLYLVYEWFKTRYLKAWTLDTLTGIPIFFLPLIPYNTNSE